MITYSKLKKNLSYLLNKKVKAIWNIEAVLEISRYLKLSGAITPASEVSERSSSGSRFFSYPMLYAKFQQNLWHAVHQVADMEWPIFKSNSLMNKKIETGGDMIAESHVVKIVSILHISVTNWKFQELTQLAHSNVVALLDCKVNIQWYKRLDTKFIIKSSNASLYFRPPLPSLHTFTSVKHNIIGTS